MRPEETPFKTGWIGFHLPGYRDHPEDEVLTYGTFSYEELPPVPTELFWGEFQWLTEPTRPPLVLDERSGHDHYRRHARYFADYVERFRQSAPAALTQLRANLLRQEIALPEEYFTLLSSADRIGLIDSVTDCYFSVSHEVIFHRNRELGCLLPFYEDSQTCVVWYLYLAPQGGSCVVASHELFIDRWYFPEEELTDYLPEDLPELLFCAPSLEEFMYRIWIENQIWYRRAGASLPLAPEHRLLNAAQRVYAEHYKKFKRVPPLGGG